MNLKTALPQSSVGWKRRNGERTHPCGESVDEHPLRHVGEEVQDPTCPTGVNTKVVTKLINQQVELSGADSRRKVNKQLGRSFTAVQLLPPSVVSHTTPAWARWCVWVCRQPLYLISGRIWELWVTNLQSVLSKASEVHVSHLDSDYCIVQWTYIKWCCCCQDKKTDT